MSANNYYRRFDTTHDGGLHSRNKTPRTTPSEGDASRTPTGGGRDKVYFRYKLSPAHTVTIECDLSPGFRLDPQSHRLLSGHIRLRCPMPDCPGWMHVWADQKTVFCHPMGLGRRHVFDTEDGFDGTYLLPVLTIHEPVRCNYRERCKGPDGFEGCRWHAVIAEGVAFDYMPRQLHGYATTSSGLSVPVTIPHDQDLLSNSNKRTPTAAQGAGSAASQEATTK